MPLEHEIKQAYRLIPALQGDLQHFGLSGGEQIPGAEQADLGLFFPEGNANHLAKDAADMSGGAAHLLSQLVKA